MFKVIAICACVVSLASAPAHSQSADALIEKLVEKGILSRKEANELREETESESKAPLQPNRLGMPDWVTSFRFTGDLRGRFDGIYSDNAGFVDRNRLRYRLRFGATAVLRDHFEVGLRLTSSERAENYGGDPISGNADFKDNAAYKSIFLDRVYGKWSPLDGPTWSFSTTVGKMENPFVFGDWGLGDAVFDPDYAPEGFSQKLRYTLNDQHVIGLHLGQFILDELGSTSNDSYMLGAQLRAESKWTPKAQTSFGVTALAISGDDALLTVSTDSPYNGVPNINRGNTRTPIPSSGTKPAFGGALANNFNPIIADGTFTYRFESAPFYSAPFPVSLGGLFMHNPAANNQGYQVGIMFGKSGKKGLWDFSYRYKVLEADVWYEEVVDSDFGAFYQSSLTGSGFGAGYGPGTNVRGHIFRANYSPYDALTLGITYYLTEAVNEVPRGSDSDIGRIQIDAVWKF